MADSPLQKYPPGLLSAFNLQTLGRAPVGFSQSVMPVANILDLYAQDLRAVELESGNVAMTSDSVSFQVPAGQVWLVWAISYSVNPVATDTAPMGVMISVMANEVRMKTQYFPIPSPVAAGNGISCAVDWTAARPFPLYAGSTIRGLLGSDFGGNVSSTLWCLFDRLTT
jgi:hypothetical protein